MRPWCLNLIKDISIQDLAYSLERGGLTAAQKGSLIQDLGNVHGAPRRMEDGDGAVMLVYGYLNCLDSLLRWQQVNLQQHWSQMVCHNIVNHDYQINSSECGPPWAICREHHIHRCYCFPASELRSL